MDKYVLLRSAVIYYRDHLPKIEADSPLEQVIFYSVEKDMLNRVLNLMDYITDAVKYEEMIENYSKFIEDYAEKNGGVR